MEPTNELKEFAEDPGIIVATALRDFVDKYNNLLRVIDCNGLMIALCRFNGFTGVDCLTREKVSEVLAMKEREAPEFQRIIQLSKDIIGLMDEFGVTQDEVAWSREIREKTRDQLDYEDVKICKIFIPKLERIAEELLRQGYSLKEIKQ